MTAPPPHLRNTSGSRFSQRLGYYLVGVAFGLVLLGLLMSARQRAVQQQAADQDARQGASQSPVPNPPAAP